MKPAALVKQVFTYLYSVLVFVACFYALVLYPYQLDDLVKGALVGWATQAIYAVLADQVASRAAQQALAQPGNDGGQG